MTLRELIERSDELIERSEMSAVQDIYLFIAIFRYIFQSIYNIFIRCWIDTTKMANKGDPLET